MEHRTRKGGRCREGLGFAQRARLVEPRRFIHVVAFDREYRGRLVESAVGAHLANAAAAGPCEVTCWRDRNREADVVVTVGRRTVAIEVKSGRTPDALRGLDAFVEQFTPTRTLLVGGGGVPLDEFLTRPVADWLRG